MKARRKIEKSREKKLREVVTKLREQAHEAESQYFTKTPPEIDYDYLAKAFRQIADELEAIYA